jgi:hypothetical protein
MAARWPRRKDACQARMGHEDGSVATWPRKAKCSGTHTRAPFGFCPRGNQSAPQRPPFRSQTSSCAESAPGQRWQALWPPTAPPESFVAAQHAVTWWDGVRKCELARILTSISIKNPLTKKSVREFPQKKTPQVDQVCDLRCVRVLGRLARQRKTRVGERVLCCHNT